MGITSYAYQWAVGTSDFKPGKPLSVFSLIEKASMLGLEVLQICENVNLDVMIKDHEGIVEAAKSKGITIELGAGGMDLSTLDGYVQIADLTGSRLLRAYPQKRESIERMIKRIRRFLPELREREITLAIENSSLCLYTCYQLAEILRRIDDPLVGACVDVANSLGLLENPVETVKVLSPYAASVHIKDFCIERRTGGGFIISGAPIGEGILDVRAVLDIIEKSNRNPNILIEQWMNRRSPEKVTLKEEERWLKKSVEFLRSVLGQSSGLQSTAGK